MNTLTRITGTDVFNTSGQNDKKSKVLVLITGYDSTKTSIEFESLFDANAQFIVYDNLNANIPADISNILAALKALPAEGSPSLKHLKVDSSGKPSVQTNCLFQRNSGKFISDQEIMTSLVSLNVNIPGSSEVTLDPPNGNLVFTHHQIEVTVIGPDFVKPASVSLIIHDTIRAGSFLFSASCNIITQISKGFAISYPTQFDTAIMPVNQAFFPLYNAIEPEGHIVNMEMAFDAYYDSLQSAVTVIKDLASPVNRMVIKSVNPIKTCFATTEGFYVSLTPASADAGFRLASFSNLLTNNGGVWSGEYKDTSMDFYFAPAGDFSVSVTDSAKSTTDYDLIAGASGNEFISLNKDDIIRFSTGHQGLVNLMGLASDQFHFVSETFENGTITSYLSFKSSHDYSLQSQDVPFYNKSQQFSRAGVFSVNGTSPIPVVPFSSNSDIITVTPKGGTPVNYLPEDHFIKPERLRIVTGTMTAKKKVRPRASSGLDRADYTSTTPNGFLAALDPGTSDVVGLKLAVSPNPVSFAVGAPSQSFQQSLLNAKSLVIVSFDKLAKIVGDPAQISDAITICDWAFSLFGNIPKTQIKSTLINFGEKALLQQVQKTFALVPDLKDLTNDTTDLKIADLQAIYADLQLSLQKEITTAESSFFALTKPLQQQTLIYRKLFSEEWNGLVCFKHQIGLSNMPKAIQGLISGIRLPDQFFASYIGFDKNNIINATGGFNIQKGSFFGKISYNDPGLLPDPSKPPVFIPSVWNCSLSDTAFYVKTLNIEFENSKITSFDSEVYVKLGKVFNFDVASPDKIYVLKGSYESKDGKEAYLFKLVLGEKIVFNNFIISEIDLDSVEFKSIGQDSSNKNINAFLFDGSIAFNNDFINAGWFPSGLGLFTSLAFKNLGFSFSLDPTVPAGFPLSINFDLFDITTLFNLSQLPSTSFLSYFPLKLTGFRFNLGSLGIDLKGLGFMPLIGSAPEIKIKFGLVFNLDLGSLGKLFPDISSLTAELMFGWSETNEKYFGMRLPNISMNNFSIGIEQVLKFEADEIDLINNGGVYQLNLLKCSLFVLGKNLFDGIQFDGMIFKKPGQSKIGWWIRGKSYQPSSVRFLGFGQRVDFPGIAQAKNFTEALNIFEATTAINYAENNGWQFATDLDIMTEINLQIIFSDPSAYGLHFSMLSGLFSAEILYHRVGDVGIWSIDMAPPGPIKNIDLGFGSLTLPNVGVSIFTNGGGILDVGMPNGNDWSRSGVFQMLPFIGMFGSKFGIAKQLGAFMSDYLKSVDDGTLPVLYVAFAGRFGLGKQISVGPLDAGISLTIYSIGEGLIRLGKNASGNLVFHDFMIRMEGGVILNIYGAVDFGIVRGGFNVTVSAGIGFVFKSDADIYLYIVASVSINVYIEVHLGFFSISFSFSINTSVQLNFYIRNANAAQKEDLSLAFEPEFLLETYAASLITIPVNIYLINEITHSYDSSGAGQPQLVFTFGFLNAANEDYAEYRKYVRGLIDFFNSVFSNFLTALEGKETSLWIDMLMAIENGDILSNYFKTFDSMLDTASFRSYFNFILNDVPADASLDKSTVVFFTPISTVLKDPQTGSTLDYAGGTVPSNYDQVLSSHFAEFLNQPNIPPVTPPGGITMINLTVELQKNYARSVLKLLFNQMISMLSKKDAAAPFTRVIYDAAINDMFSAGTQAFVVFTGASMSRFMRQGLIVPDPAPTATNIPYYAMTGQQRKLSDFKLTPSDIPGDAEHSMISLGDAAGKLHKFYYKTQDLISPPVNFDIAVKQESDPDELVPLTSALQFPLLPAGASQCFSLPSNFVNSTTLPINVQMQTKKVTPTGVPSSPVAALNDSDFTIGTLLEFTLHQVAQATGSVMYMFDKGGEINLPLLNDILNDGGIKQIQCAFLWVAKDGPVSIPGNPALYKTNLSVRSNPANDFPSFAEDAVETSPIYFTTYDNDGDNKNFFGIIKQYCITNANGFYINFGKAPTMDTVMTLRMILLPVIAAAPQTIKSYHNSVLIKAADPQSVYNITSLKAENSLNHLTPRQMPFQERFNIVRNRSQAFDFIYSNLAYDFSGTAAIKQEKMMPIMPQVLVAAGGTVDTSTQWEYEQVFGVVPYKMDPTVVQNRYSGIKAGPVGQLNFYLRDHFGNSIKTNQTLDVNHGYFDPIVPLAEWPGMSFSFTIKGSQINVFGSYHPGVTTPDNQTAIKQKYNLILEQFNGVGFTAAIEAFGQTVPINVKSTLVPLVANIIADPATPFDDYPTLSAGLANSIAFPAGQNYITIDVQLSFRRDKQYLHPYLLANYGDATVSEILSALSELKPSVEAYGNDLKKLAADFESNYTNAKLGKGLVINTNQESLWAIDKGAMSGITVNGTDLKSPHFYAVKPISTTLYSSSSDPSGISRFNNLDLDNEMRIVLNAIETLLDPVNIIHICDPVNPTAAQISNVNQLLTFKNIIAKQVFATAEWLIPVSAAETRLASANLLAEVVSYFEANCKNIYNFDTAATLGINNKSWVGGNMLYLQQQTDNADVEAVFSKIDFTKSAPDLSVIFNYLKNDQLPTDTISQFDYALDSLTITHIEHNIQDPDANQYQASYWIQLLIPQPIFSTASTLKNVPVVLKQYPTDTRIIGHGQSSVAPQNISDTRKWGYFLNLESDLESQDIFTLTYLLSKKESTDLFESKLSSYTDAAPFILPEQLCISSALWKLNGDRYLKGDPLVDLKDFASGLASIVSPAVPLEEFADLLDQTIQIDLNIAIKADTGTPANKHLTITAIDPTQQYIDVNKFVLNFNYSDVSKQISFQNGNPPGNTYSATIPDTSLGYLQITYPNMDILIFENVQAGIMITRNSVIGGLILNQAFVYQTPLKMFGNPLHPQLTFNYDKLVSSCKIQDLPSTIGASLLTPLTSALRPLEMPAARKIELELRYSRNAELESALNFVLSDKVIDATTIKSLTDQIAALETITKPRPLHTAGTVKVLTRIYSSDADDKKREVLYIKNLLFKLI